MALQRKNRRDHPDRRGHPLAAGTPAALLDDRIPAIRIARLAAPGECRICAVTARAGTVMWCGGKRKIGRIGQARPEYRWIPDTSRYVKAVEPANRDLAAVLAQSFDPLQRMSDRSPVLWS